MSVGRESIRRAANAGAGKTVKKPVVSTKEAEKPETISVTEEKKKTAKGSVHINEELPVYLKMFKDNTGYAPLEYRRSFSEK